MWIIYEKKTLTKALKKLPIQVLKQYELWKRIVELDGPAGLKKVKGLHDEALTGNLKGCRSSRLNIKWRVIYKLENKQLEVFVIDINPHKY